MDILGNKGNVLRLANKRKVSAPKGGNRALNATVSKIPELQLGSQHHRAELIFLVPTSITVAALAHTLSIRAVEVIKELLRMGTMVTINQSLDQRTAMAVVKAFGVTAVAAQTRRLGA